MAKTELVDQLGNKLSFDRSPRSIISLVPSITEYLFYLELDDQISGITNFCIEPKNKVENYTKVGGTKTFNVEQILKSGADLIIANKEENIKEKIDEIKSIIPTYISDVNTLEDALQMMSDIALICGKTKQSKELLEGIQHDFNTIKVRTKPKKVVYLIWQNPIMIAGKNTFISDIIKKCGFDNVGENLGERYPSVTVEDIRLLKPDFVILSTEPYRFNADHVKEWKELIPLSTVILADASYFSWYGNRLKHSADYITDLLNNAE